MSEVLEVAAREKRGTLNNRRLRLSGSLPAVLYGHGQDSVSLSIPTDQMETTLRHGAKVVELKGAASGQALLQDIQWDTFQRDILHVDLLRVDADERITVVVSLATRGEAPGEHEGGIVELVKREVEIETSPANIPDTLHIPVKDLHLGGALNASDIEDLPPGASVVGDVDATLVHCVEPTAAPEEEEEGEAASAEPEVIGRKEDEEAAAE